MRWTSTSCGGGWQLSNVVAVAERPEEGGAAVNGSVAVMPPPVKGTGTRTPEEQRRGTWECVSGRVGVG